jgi:6,7-dimethyl-8-ribityllumazine synthase
MSHHKQHPRIIEGGFHAKGLKFAIVASRFNHIIVEKLLDGALDCLTRHGADPEEQTVVWVPGSWEIPLASLRLAEKGGFDAIICVGAVIRGGTAHFDYVAGEVSKGIAHVGLSKNLPVTMGILTTDNLEQSIERAGSKMGNKGWDAAMAAIETTNVLKALGES